MTELKPCAHCGGESELISDNDGHYVRCMCCATEFKQATKEGAINLWNRRAISREKILLELLGQDTEDLGKEAIKLLNTRPQSLTEKVKFPGRKAYEKETLGSLKNIQIGGWNACVDAYEQSLNQVSQEELKGFIGKFKNDNELEWDCAYSDWKLNDMKLADAILKEYILVKR